jgi:hypothetical protein
VGGANGALASLATGSINYVLTSNGAGNAPTFQANPAGTWVKFSTQNPSGVGSVPFTSLISNTYNSYAVLFSNVTLSAGSNLELEISSNNGSSWLSSTYISGFWYLQYNSVTLTNINSSSIFLIGTGLASSVQCSGYIMLYNFGSSGLPSINGQSITQKTAGIQFFGGYVTTSATYNAISFLSTTGNISGTFTLYGIVQ